VDKDKHKNWLKFLALADDALKRMLAAAKALDLGGVESRPPRELLACPPQQ
jgi:hypothetical protein